MKSFPILYKKAKTGAAQQWKIVVEKNRYWTEAGQVGGAITVSEPTICEGKNIGRANETTSNEQALAEAQSKWQKKIETGYYTSLDDIDHGTTYFEPMLAKQYNDYKDDIAFPCFVSAKLDGLRMIATKKGLTTRNGKPFKSCPHIHRILKPIFDKHPNWVLDGEIYSQDVPFEKIVSLTRKKNPTPEDLKESERVCQFWIFDGVVDNKKASFKNRFYDIQNEFFDKLTNGTITDKHMSIRFVENYKVFSDKEIRKYHTQFVANGFEGAMIRNPESSYENKRSKHLLKFKEFLDDEYIIIDVVEGVGNRRGMAGNLVFKLKDGRSFGSGIKGGEELYKELLKNKHNYIGKKATVRYQNMTEDGMPRFPVCVHIDPIDR